MLASLERDRSEVDSRITTQALRQERRANQHLYGYLKTIWREESAKELPQFDWATTGGKDPRPLIVSLRKVKIDGGAGSRKPLYELTATELVSREVGPGETNIRKELELRFTAGGRGTVFDSMTDGIRVASASSRLQALKDLAAVGKGLPIP